MTRGLGRRHTLRDWPATMPAFSESGRGCQGPGHGPWPLPVPTCPPEHLHRPAPAHSCTRARGGSARLAPAKDGGELVTNPQFQPLLPNEVNVAWSCLTLRPYGLYSPWNYPGQDTGVGNPSLLQGIFPTQGSNPGLLHCGWIPYQLSHKGRPRILERVAYPFSSRSS